jgi:glucosyl-dolichyl phosphate glucuronosyltransferase
VDVSVVVCSYNRAPSVGLTLAALARQVTPPGRVWELVLVDNNSSDSTPDLVQAFAASAPMPVRYHFEARQGLSYARNAGLTLARGRIIAFTDDDVTPAPDWVESVASTMEARAADVVGGSILPDWQAPPPRWLVERPQLQRELAILEHPEFAPVTDPRATPPIWGANMAFRKRVFEAVGCFDTRRGVRGGKLYRGEELHLLDRALAAGFRAIYHPAIVVWHRIGPDRLRVRHFSRHFFQHAEGRALARDGSPGRSVLGVAVKDARIAARLFAGCAWAAVRARADTLDRWLDCCDAAGTVWGSWRRRRPPPPSPSGLAPEEPGAGG